MRRSVWLGFGLVMILAVLCFTSACAKQAVQAETSEKESRSAQARTDGPVGQDERLQADLNAPTATDQNIRFEFDCSALSPRAQQVLVGKAEYLRRNPHVTVTIEGHCDVRGTPAYNIALGERRANSVKDFLVYMGIGANRLNTISYGEEKPIALGQNEASWAQNRRAEFVIN